MGQQVLFHGFRLGDGFVRAFSAGGNQPRRGRVRPVNLDGLVQAVLQELGDPVPVQQARAVDDDEIKILFPGDDLQEQGIDHEDQEGNGSVDDGDAVERGENSGKGAGDKHPGV